MKKRVVWVGLVAALVVWGAVPVEAGTTLRLGHTDPPDGLRHKAATLFAGKVKEYHAGSLWRRRPPQQHAGDDPKLLEQVKLGASTSP